ncbi:hypothetical protein [Halococcus thailandensis]|uniref:Uncharacterized protein n=1 Tax=Halococcus thailandensis JCM 13552 TaxID=1227457 RepID=M0NF43_9EURY|nr:hypothetical protein [Halococcus thailandensis]EMA56461.1 hypothetical protein C451_02013 [Halococcus thailandensis JCM 13552]
MSYAQTSPTDDRDREHEYRHDNHDHDDRHPALTPLVIDVIPDQTRAELEAVIDEPLAVERFGRHREGGDHHSFTIGTVGAGKSVSTKAELLADSREDSESGKHTNDRRES